MGKFDGILLLSDMDGTMLDDVKDVPRRNVEAIDYFISNGGLFSIASGRSEKSIRRYLEVFNINAPVICYNGSMIYDYKRGETLWSNPLRRSSAAVVIDDVKRSFPRCGVEIYYCDGIAIMQPNYTTEAHMSREFLDFSLIGMEGVREPWYKAIFAMDHEELVEVEAYIRDKKYAEIYGELHFVYSEPFFYEMLDSSSSKGLALTHLARLCGVEIKKTYAIGDNYNDQEMLRMAGLGIVAGNAPDDIKAIAGQVVCSNNDGAVGAAIEYIDSLL